MHKSSGFTLIELVMVIVILSIVAAMSARPMLQGFQAFISSQTTNTLDWQGNNALEMMVRKIRTLETSADITTATASQFTFTAPSGSSFSYTMSGGNIQENSSALVSDATGLTFIYYTRAGATTTTITAIRFVQIIITLVKDGVTYTYRTAVNLPNLA